LTISAFMASDTPRMPARSSSAMRARAHTVAISGCWFDSGSFTATAKLTARPAIRPRTVTVAAPPEA
jgi:hypothetical protein